jgi:hypothetical protein
MNLAVLVIFFNREHSILKLMDRLREIQPERLYLACDGAREGVPDEAAKVNRIRRIVLDSIDWDCEVFTNFQESNLGCKYNVSGSVSWFFGKEQKGIVLEDDCIPTVGFFRFAQSMLDYYADDRRIGSISGRNEVADRFRNSNPYFFTRKFFCWGWASWSDRILDNNVELGLQAAVQPQTLSDLPLKERLMVKGMIGLIQSRVVNSWAYPFDLSFRQKRQLCLVPSKNLVRNIGFDTVGAHAENGQEDILPVQEDFEAAPDPRVLVKNDEDFMDALIAKRYPYKLKLFLFSMARYLAPLKKKLIR